VNIVELVKLEHNIKIGDKCPEIEPNITEDTIFTVDGVPIGFYLKKIDGKLAQYIEIANAELNSDRVPKDLMNRGPVGSNADKAKKAAEGIFAVSQYSTIIGSCAPRPHMRMPYPRRSMVHDCPTAKTFIKAMLLACKEAEEVIKKIAPNIYNDQLRIIEEKVPPKWRFGRLFTSSISNFNIAASYHRDAGNLEGCVNVIIAKRQNAKGGNTTVPDYGATVDSSDNSMLVYPAWRNVHGVTPIVPLGEGGYRNSLVFYPLKAFSNYWDEPRKV
jgi:hypothetical protein